MVCGLLLLCSCSKNDPITRPGNLDYKAIGAAARNILSSEKYTSLRIEVQYMPGYQADAAVLVNYTNFLNTYINKSFVTISQQQIAASGKTILTIADVVSIERSNRTAFTNGTEVGLHILIADADYSEPNTIGIAYWNTSLCLFGKLIYKNSGIIGQVSTVKLESTVLQHETGHILGLVDEGSPMQVNHKDTANGMHCINTACLMYYGIESAVTNGTL